MSSNITKISKKITEKELAIASMRSESSLMEDYGKVRSETSHTQYLATFFRKIGESGIKNLLILICKWSNQANCQKLKGNISSIQIDEIKVTPEFPINTNDYGAGSVDIVIEIKIRPQVSGSDKINIIIENKIDASETVKGKNGKEVSIDKCRNDKNVRYQTDAYYDFFDSNYKNDLNIFVYLKPLSTWELYDIKSTPANKVCNSPYYTIINYQELYNDVIKPYYESTNRKDKKIKDYIRALGLPKNSDANKLKTPIMARNEEEQKLLKELLTKHSQIFAEAIEVMAGNPDIDEDLREAYTTIAKSLNAIRSRGTIYVATLIGGNSVKGTMWEIVKEFAIFLLDKGHSTCDVNSEIQLMRTKKGSRKTTVLCFSDTSTGFSVYTNNKPRAIKFEHPTGKEYYLTDQWGASGTNVTFCTFMENVNNKYSDFQIHKK